MTIMLDDYHNALIANACATGMAAGSSAFTGTAKASGGPTATATAAWAQETPGVCHGRYKRRGFVSIGRGLKAFFAQREKFLTVGSQPGTGHCEKNTDSGDSIPDSGKIR